MVRRSVFLKNDSQNLILSDSLLKNFETISFDVLSVPGARPVDIWDFLPPCNKYKKIVLFLGGNALENFTSKGGIFRSAQEPAEVAVEICDLAQALILRATDVFIVAVPPRGTVEIQNKVLELNAELNLYCRYYYQRITFVGISHYLYDLKHISKDLCHLEKGAFAKVHKLLNEKVLKTKFKVLSPKKFPTLPKVYFTSPF